MKRTIIVHGKPDKEEYLSETTPPSQMHWLPWLQKEVAARGAKAITPDMPVPYEPDYEAWLEEFEKAGITEETNLVGHSCGAGFLIRFLSENNQRVGKVALVAPWIDPNHTNAPQMFGNWIMNETVAGQTNGMRIFVSSNDEIEILKSVEELKLGIRNIEIQTFTNHGHFTEGDMGTKEFPELLEYLTT